VEENQHSGDSLPKFPPLFELARKSAKHLLRLESALLIILALYLSLSAVIKGVSAPGALAGEIAFSLTASIALFICSKAFATRRSHGRAPALLANLIALGVAYFMISGKLVWVGFALALLAALTAISALLGYTE